ncbi:MAG: glycosyltransferase [Anaerolineales bacterium]|nr:glycosyltransferase [Anaerolineales bacterium]NUQ83838.1 glycosyltransferase [Anaerolineales bacterium]
MKILFLSRWFPYPTNNGSKIRIYNLLRGLSQLHDVTLLSFVDQPEASPEAPEAREICSKVKVVPWREFDPGNIRARLALFNLKPRSIVDTFSPEMAGAITETLREEQYDLIIASQLQMAAYHPYFRNVPAIFEEFEIGLFHDRAFSADGRMRFRHALTWFKLRLYLSQLLGSFRSCTVVSERERQLLARNFPRFAGAVEVIPNGLNVEEYNNVKVEKKPNTLIFTGSFKYNANYEAMSWFVGEVFPLILEKTPDAHLIVTGDHANLPLPSSRNIALAGFVEDVKPLIASSMVSLAPLLSGGGTRLKILEAMALGTPVVATSKGAEGLDAMDGEHLLLADSPAQFADCVIRLLTDEKLRRRLAGNASLLVEAKYNWGRAFADYSRLMKEVFRR